MEPENPLRKLKVLWVEDDPVDIELGLRELTRAGFEVSVDAIQCVEDLQRRLSEQSYDLVLADYNLSGWTGMDALELLRWLGHATPFILISGKLGEETAVECIKTGAADCVLKDSLVRLPVAVRRALDEARSAEALRASERRYRLLFERNLAGVFRSNLDGLILECNESCARILGYDSPAELSAQAPEVYFNPAARHALITTLSRSGAVSNLELELRRKDGCPVWTLLNATLVAGEHGEPAVIEGTLVDVSEKKRAEDRVLRLNRLYSVLSHMNQAIVHAASAGELFSAACQIAVEKGLFRMAWFGQVDPEGGLVRPAAHAGLEEGYLEAIRISIGDDPAGRGPTGSALREGRHFVCNNLAEDTRMLPWREEALRRGYRSSAAFPVTLEGRVVGAFSLYAAEPAFFDDENVALLEEVAADVSFALERLERRLDRQRAEEALRRGEEKYRQIVETAGEGIWVLDEQQRVVFANREISRMLGCAAEQMLGRRAYEFMDEDSAAIAREKLEPRGQSEGTSPDFRMRRADGSELWVILRSTPLLDGQGRPDGVLGMFTDITARKRAEEERAQFLARAEAARAQAKAEARFRELMEAAPDAILLIDRFGKVALMNRAAERLFGYHREELVGKSAEVLIPARFRERHQGFRTGCLSYPQTRTMNAVTDPRARRKDGSEISVEIELSPVETEEGELFTCIIRDVTERRHLEEQLRQSQKMEALGRLAGGVAHDFNNLLTIIGGYGQMVLDSLRPKDPLRKDLEPIMEAAYRASTLTRQLLTFSRRQVVQPKLLDLNRVVGKMNKMLRRVIGEDIELVVSLKPGLGRVKADAEQIGQVLMNLAVNARDAMPGGGRLTVETGDVELGKDRQGPELAPGHYIELTVRDTGIGMDAQTRGRIFEPFFTTKDKGKGTGLGLSTVYGIVKQAGGDIQVESEPGRGAAFHV